jgi:quinol---cytochrome-c reductase cytochrome c subunit
VSARVFIRLVALGAAVAGCALLVPGAAGAAPGKGTPQGRLAAKGYRLYGEYCLACHGPNAAGRVPGPSRSIGAGPLRDQQRQRGIGPSLQGVGALAADLYLRTGYMPLPHVGLQPRRRRQVLGESSIRALVAYVASFGGPPIPQPQPQLGNLSEGQSLFTEHCAGCHQVVAQGGYVTNAIAEPLRTAGMNATTIAEAVRTGPYVMPKFTYGDLSSRQLDSIVRYVLWAQRPAHPGGWGIAFIGPVPEGLVAWFVALPLLIVFCLVLGRRLRT